MPNRFVAPKRLDTLDDVRKALQRIQEQLDANDPQPRSALLTTDVTLRAGEVVRISPRQGETVFAKLPKAQADNYGSEITIILERPAGTLRLSAQAPDTINGFRATNFTVATRLVVQSNGVDQWVSVNALPSTSPGGSALDAEYVLGAAHASLPNGRVATDSAEVDAVLTTPNVISWALNTASVGFSKLANLTGLSVLGRAANSTGVMTAITATAARQVLQNNDAGTALQWGLPTEARADGVDIGDTYVLDVIGGRYTAAAGVASLDMIPDAFTVTGMTGTQNAYALPVGLKTGDIVNWGPIAGPVTLNGIVATGVPDGFEFTLTQSNGGFPDGDQVTIVDESGSATAANRIGTPDNISVIVGTAGAVRFRRVGSPTGGRWTIVERGFPRASTSIAYGGLSGREMQLQAAVAGAGMTMTSQVLNVIGSTSITVNANDIQRPALTGAITATANSNATAFGALAAKSVLANATNASAVPAALAGSAAFQYLRVNSANTGLEWAVLSLSAFPSIAAGSFLANVTAGAAVPTAHDLATFAGAGLTYTNVTGIMAVGAGTGITVNANDVQLTTIADDTFMANVSGSAAVATGKTFTSLAGDGIDYDATSHELDIIGTSNNDVLVRAGGAWTVDNLGAGTVLANLSEGPNSTGAADQTNLEFMRSMFSNARKCRVFEEDFQGNLTATLARFTQTAFAGTLKVTSVANIVGMLSFQNNSPNGTTRGIVCLGASETAAEMQLSNFRYLGVRLRPVASSIAVDTGFQIGLVAGASFAGYGAGTAGLSSTSIGLWWQYRTDASSGEWVAGTRQGGSDSSTASGTVVAANTIYDLEIFRDVSGNLYYYLDGTLVRTDSTAGTLALAGGATFYFTQIGSTTATRSIAIDWVRIVSSV